MELTADIIEKAKKLEAVDELINLAKENGEELTLEKAEELFARLHGAGELTDDELDDVAGGFMPGPRIKPYKPPYGSNNGKKA